METTYTLILKLISSGGTVYALAAFGACILLSFLTWKRIQEETQKDRDKKDAKQEFLDATNSGDANRLRRAIERLRDITR